MVSVHKMQRILEEALKSGGDFSELYFEDSLENNLFRTDGHLTGVQSVRICGAGVYVLQGTNSAYVYTNDLSYEGLLRAASEAAELLSPGGGAGGARLSGKELSPVSYANPNPCRIRPSEKTVEERAKVAEEAERAALCVSCDLKSLETAQYAKEQHVIVANSDGLYTEDDRVTDRTRFTYLLERGGSRKRGWEDYTKPQGFEAYDCMDEVRDCVREMIAGAAASFDGKRVKSCRVPVIMEAGVCGTLWHEACGHPLESTAISGHGSDYEGLLGEKIGTDKVTLIDDGTIPGLYGSRSIDDEGHPTQKNILIDHGVLKGYLCDRLGGRKLGMPSTGSGRRQGYMYAPVARMSNTYLEVGDDAEEDLLSSIDQGLYIKSFGGGSGGREFSLEVAEGYWIENGEITYPVKGMMLTGRGLELLKKIDGVGRIQGYDRGSFCGAASGLCPVTAFQPRIRISEMNVGGEEA